MQATSSFSPQLQSQAMSAAASLPVDAVTALLPALGRGKTGALGALYELLYADLLHLAKWRVRRSGELAAMDPNSLVHESFLRFARCGPSHLRDRNHFLCYAGRVMCSIMVDAVRHRLSGRCGGGADHVELDDETDHLAICDDPSGVVARVHEALEELACREARLARIVEMLYSRACPRSRSPRPSASPCAPWHATGTRPRPFCGTACAEQTARRHGSKRLVIQTGFDRLIATLP